MKYKILEVTCVKHYVLEMYDDERTKINGWKIKDVIKSWFENFPLYSYHASRDSHGVHGSSYVTNVKIVDSVETKKFKYDEDKG